MNEIGKHVRRERFMVLIMFLCSVAYRWLYACATEIPARLTCYPDELRYYEIAESLANGNGLTIAGLPTDFQKVLYCVTLVPAFFISNINLRMSIIFFINALLLSSGVFAMHYLCTKMIRRSSNRLVLCALYLICGLMVNSLSVISENLWIPLAMVIAAIFYRLFEKAEAERRIPIVTVTVAAGASMLGYLTKEIALIFPLSYVLWTAWKVCSANAHAEEQATSGKKRAYLISLMLYVGLFAALFVLLKSTAFRGLGNSYRQQNPEALLEYTDTLQFLLYGAVYFIFNVAAMCGVVALVLPAVFYRQAERAVRNFYIFLMLLLVSAAAVVSYTITIREDYTLDIPRAHMRYVAWLLPLLLVVTAHVIEKRQTLSAAAVRRDLCFASLSGLLLGTFYRGVYSGSGIDNTMELLERASGNQVLAYLAVCTAFLAMLIAGHRRTRYVFTCFIILMGCMQLGDTVLEQRFVARSHYVSEEDAAEADQLAAFVMEHASDKILLVCEEFDNNSKIFDTWLPQENLYTTTEGLLSEMLDNDEVNLSEETVPVIWSELWWNYGWTLESYYPIADIEYLIIRKSVKLEETVSCVLLSEESTASYNIYRIDSSKPIRMFMTYLADGEFIRFAGEERNADYFVSDGLSWNERDYAWTDGRNVTFERLKLGDSEGAAEYTMTLTVAGVFEAPQQLYVYCGTEEVFSGEITVAGEYEILVKTDEAGCLTLSLSLPDAVSPLEKGISDDDRVLALQLVQADFSVSV